MDARLWERKTLVVCLLMLLAGLIAIVGCGSNTPEGATTTASSANASTTAADNATTTTSAAVQLSQWDKDLAKTASTQAELTQILIEQKAADDDPRMGIIYGLRARTLAIACRQALDRNDLTLADSAMLEVRYTLNESRDIATGPTAQTLADARTVIDNLGAPSGQPTQAATLLDEFIAALAPMLDEANSIFATTTTT